MGYRGFIKNFITMGALYFPIRKAVYLTLGLVSRILPWTGTESFVLCYHSISTDNWLFGVLPETFRRQMEYLSTRYEFVTLEQISNHINHKKKLPKPSVAITFDDGYQDILQIVDVVKKYNIRPTLFIMSNSKVNRKELDTDRKILTKKEIHSLIEMGWEIGCHTATHADMHSISGNQIENEIVRSKAKLESQFGIPIQYIAYPKGRYSAEILEAAQRAGYKLGMTVEDGEISPQTNHLRVPRIGVDRTHSFWEFKFLPDQLVGKFRTIVRRFGYGI